MPDLSTLRMRSRSTRTKIPKSAQPLAGIQVARLASLPEARALAPEWARLAETAGAGNPFHHPDLLVPWVERSLRPGEQIWLLAARKGGRLVGVAPLYRRSWGPGLAHSMQLWGTGRGSNLVELPQFLLGQEQPRAVARALVDQLCADSGRWDWAELLLGDGLWLEPDWLPRGGTMTLLTKGIRANVVLPVTLDEPPALKRNVRESLRRARNRLERAYPGGWSITCATSSADVPGAVSDLAGLHGERSRLAGKKRHPNALAREADWTFLSTAVTALATRGAVAVYRLMADGLAIAALLVLRTEECTYFLLSGMSQSAWEFSPVTLLQRSAIDDAIARGQQCVNFSTGADTPKLRWSEKLTLTPEFVLVPDRFPARVRFGTYWQASAAAAVARERHRHTLAGESEVLASAPCHREPAVSPPWPRRG